MPKSTATKQLNFIFWMRRWNSLAGATIDHLVSVTLFLAAMLLFISLFNQTIQTAVIYQQHRAVATKCSDLLDTILLAPNNATTETWTYFGLQDPEFTQYVLSPFSLMRLDASTGVQENSVYYEKTGKTYSNMTVGFGNSLLMPMDTVVEYSSALKMIGINGTYGFQLTLTPLVTVAITEISSNPLTLAIDVSGVGFPLANAEVSYCLMPVSLSGAYPEYLTSQPGTVSTNPVGSTSVSFPGFTPSATLTYVFMAHAHVGGVTGVGFYTPEPSSTAQLIPFVDSLSALQVILAHSYDVNETAGVVAPLAYNASFVFWGKDFNLQTSPWAADGTIASGSGNPFGTVTLPSDKTGILVVAYGNGTAGGVAVMPWGVGSLAFPIAFGDDPTKQEWVATDMRQVLISGVAYQAKLSLWSLAGIQVVG
jgi:hypothetical protein